MTIILLVAGLILLVTGAEALVRGAARLAVSVGISPLVIGLTIVAFATSSPELAVGIQAGLLGESDIVVGNVIGSNIFNILFILGLSALLTPLIVNNQLVRFDVPLMIGVSILVWLMALDGQIDRSEGVLLFVGIVAYSYWSIHRSYQENARVTIQDIEGLGDIQQVTRQHWSRHVVYIVVGLVALTLGSRWLVEGAVAIARLLGVSELVIGLTIVAIGTSLPEIATSVVAALRGERDIAVGNAVGSNIFNLLSVMGIASIVSPGGISVSSSAVGFDMLVMIAVAAMCLPIFITGNIITRWEGGLFFGYYMAYTVYLILYATQPDALIAFSLFMVIFIILPTIAILGVATIAAVRARLRRPRVT